MGVGTFTRWVKNVLLFIAAAVFLVVVAHLVLWGCATNDRYSRTAPCQSVLAGLDIDHISLLSTADTETMTKKGYRLTIPDGSTNACGSVSYGGTAQEFSMEFGDCTTSLVTANKDIQMYDIRKGYSIPSPDPYSSRILVQTQRASDLPSAQDLKKLPAFASCR